jgi:excisionase family DNA binding protein
MSIMLERTKSMPTSQPMTPHGAAAYLGLDVKTITRWARQGYLPAHPLGEGKRKFWRFLEHELVAWLAAKTNSPEPA